MSLRKSPKRTEAQLIANRRNSGKSTGPKTEEGKRRSSANSYKYGYYATPDTDTRQQMLRAGEDPDLLARLEREFTQALQPSNAMEAMIVADIARLYGDKALLQKSVRATRLEQADCEAQSDAPIDEEQLRLSGYLSFESRPGTLEPTLKLLNHLLERAEKRDFARDDDLNQTLALLGGSPLLPWCRGVQGSFEELTRRNPETEKLAFQSSLDSLVKSIAEMKKSAYNEELEYCRQRAEALAEEPDNRCIPGTRRWSIVLKQQARLDRMIEAKMRLLMRLKKEWPAENGVPQEDVTQAVSGD